MTLPLAARVPAAVLLGALGGAVCAYGTARVGATAALGAFGAGAMVALALHPRLTLAGLFAFVVLVEEDAQTFLAAPGLNFLPPGPLRVTDLLLLAVIAGTVLHVLRSRRGFRVPGPFVWPLALLAVAMAMAVAVALTGTAGAPGLEPAARKLLYLLVLPFVVANLLTTRRDVRLALVLAVVLVGVKTAVGAVGYILGAGRSVEGTVLTYYGPTANFLLLAFVLGVVAAVLARIRLPNPVLWLAPAAATVLILSFRRNFWIAAVLGVVLIILVVTDQRGRALLIPAGAVVAAALYLGLTALTASQSDSPVVQRVQSLSPTKLQSGAYDRYRIDEQRNVRAEIAANRFTGIGLGVPWRARYPLAVALPGGRDYTHVVVLWYWLKLGILGVAAYVWLIVTALRQGIAVWRRSSDRPERVAGLALGIGFVGLAVAETTGSFLGVDSRLTPVAAVAMGWLAAANALPAAQARLGR